MTRRTGIISRYLDTIIVLMFTVVVAAVILSAIWSGSTVDVQRDAAGEELETLVNNELDPECAGTGTWVDFSSNFGLQDDIARVVYQDGYMNATMEGDSGYVSHPVNNCDAVHICNPGQDVDPDTRQCPHDQGYIPGGSPSVHIWVHPDANLIIIDPDT